MQRKVTTEKQILIGSWPISASIPMAVHHHHHSFHGHAL